jgi:hypothetical protein
MVTLKRVFAHINQIHRGLSSELEIFFDSSDKHFFYEKTSVEGSETPCASARLGYVLYLLL